MKTLLTKFLLFAALAIPASAKTEFGKLGAAEFRIDVPANWNHGLVLYCHGYDPHPVGVGYDPKKPLPPELMRGNVYRTPIYLQEIAHRKATQVRDITGP